VLSLLKYCHNSSREFTFHGLALEVFSIKCIFVTWLYFVFVARSGAAGSLHWTGSDWSRQQEMHPIGQREAAASRENFGIIRRKSLLKLLTVLTFVYHYLPPLKKQVKFFGLNQSINQSINQSNNRDIIRMGWPWPKKKVIRFRRRSGLSEVLDQYRGFFTIRK